MPKKEWTEEERKAFGAKMKASREAKARAKKEAAKQPEAKPEEIVSNEDVQALIRRVKELESKFGKTEATQETPRVTSQGSLVGSFEKYPTQSSLYPDPRERLSNEPRLQRFAFKINNALNWEVATTNYQTIDGVNVREPRFKLELISIHMGEDGTPNGEAHVIRTMLFHEDPDTALTIANQLGLDVGDNQAEFLNEMRYLRMRDWLIQCFYPTPAAAVKKKRQEVINNSVVEVFEISSPDSQAIPFGELNGKL